ncbi:hypothetical protein NXC14_PA00034 (plasmid) [Rhizobium sp. NXC14]|uniref:DUF2252 family protein n=1 Tax=Rhizobium sp. NXC14 TaxID=1981173 RepID=UPI000A201A75|nr:DUF2252 family protein [Rhizobium sp. NXC14]ARO32331.1 hypothetical protein NXC14_PA00034 [Rhizobium sp. NXC14]
MSVVRDVERFEAWLRSQCEVDEKGLQKKHSRMARNAFRFFRATCFRFARKAQDRFPDLARAPRVLGVGDAHIENWGTWRDAEGRLVWGVNDFDEAAVLPYTYDLLQLATSARLAQDIPGSNGERADAILVGYRRGLRAPAPCFVDDETPWLEFLTTRPTNSPGAFKSELATLQPVVPPPAVERLLRGKLPNKAMDVEFGTWLRGGGALGRPRYVAVGKWLGGLAVREAKALVPSAWYWAAGVAGKKPDFMRLARGPYRSPDPFLTVHAGYVVRRIAADSAKIDLGSDYARAYGLELLAAMGADIAAIHVARAEDAPRILDDLATRNDDWLHVTARKAAQEVREDYEDWKIAYERSLLQAGATR